MLLSIITLIVLLSILSMKRSRPDGFPVMGLHPYRKLMFYIMPSRNESQVYFKRDIPAQAMLDFLATQPKDTDTSMTYLLLMAIGKTLEEHVEMNRFVSGRHLYQRNGVWITFSMKRQKLDKKSAIAMVKMRYHSRHSFRKFCTHVNEEVLIQRSGTKTYADKEFDFFTKLPRPLLNIGVKLFQIVDYYNFLPKSFIENDGLYASVVVANLGSLKMDPGYHHLYEWGNCPIFITAGQIQDVAQAKDGIVESQKVLPLRITYDERIDDGLTAKGAIDRLVEILENPQTYLETEGLPLETDNA